MSNLKLSFCCWCVEHQAASVSAANVARSGLVARLHTVSNRAGNDLAATWLPANRLLLIFAARNQLGKYKAGAYAN